MFRLFRKINKHKKLNSNIEIMPNAQEQEAIVNNDMSFEEMYIYVQEQMLKNDDADNADEKQNILSNAMSGDIEAIKIVKSEIRKYIDNSKNSIKEMDIDTAVNRIFSHGWGLGVVDEYSSDNTVDEIRVNGPDNVYIVKNGISEKTNVSFKNENEIETIIKRMIIEDVGITLDRSSPRIESVRKDGSRLTATCYPVTKSWTFILRKHTSFTPTIENYLKSKTFDNNVWQILSVLVRGRASFLISGNVGSGKTTLMKRLVGELNEKLRILVIGKDLELKLSDEYPERDIIELEEHPHVGATMKALFETTLRESPDVIIVEEFRGSGEAVEAVRACTRGLPGSMATAHFNSAEEAIEGTGLFMLEEGLNLTLDMAKLRVARAFNIVVQMYGDAITGHKRLISITEVIADEEGKISYNELIRWKPSVDDCYLGDGNWEIVNKPSQQMLNHLIKNVNYEELEKMRWL